MNAFTGQEVTAYYVRVPDRHLPLALDILSDIVWSPALRADEVESERHVILEEIRMRDDTPDDLVHEVFTGALFPDHPLGREVAGTQTTVTAMTRDAIAEYHAAHYQPSNVVVAVAGSVDHDAVVAQIAAAQPATPTDRPVRRNGADAAAPEPLVVLARPLEQTHVVLGARALRRDDPDRFALTVLDQVLGGGMSSASVPGGTGEARPRVFGVLVPERVRGDGCARGLLRHRAERVDEVLEVVARGARSPRLRRRDLRARAHQRQGPPHRLVGPVVGELVEPHAPHRPQRAHDGGDPQPRLGGRAGRRGRSR